MDIYTPLPPTPMPKLKLKKYNLTEDELDVDLIDDAEMKMSNIATFEEESLYIATKNYRLFGDKKLDLENRFLSVPTNSYETPSSIQKKLTLQAVDTWRKRDVREKFEAERKRQADEADRIRTERANSPQTAT